MVVGTISAGLSTSDTANVVKTKTHPVSNKKTALLVREYRGEWPD